MRYKTGFLVFLLALMLISYGCGSGGVGGSAQNDGGIATGDIDPGVAQVSLTLNYPADASGSAKLLSPNTTHILVNAKQWVTDDLNKLSVVNTDKTLVVVSGGTTISLELLPTWTRICASQWKGNPNDLVTSSLLETTCTFGRLAGGNNPISLTLIRGEWTLSIPTASGVQAVALAKASTQDSIYDYVDVYDGRFGSQSLQQFTSNAQAYNNWGSIYGAMFKQYGSYQTLPNSYGVYQNFFSPTNPNLPYLFFGTFDEILISPGPPTVYQTVGSLIGGFSNVTDPATGLLDEVRDMIIYPYDYYGYEPVLFRLNSSTKIEELVGGVLVDATAIVLDPCHVTITGGNVIDACAFDLGDIDIVRVPAGPAGAPPASYRYKMSSTATVQGPNICYQDESNAGKDSLNNTICTDYSYSSYSTSVQTCSTPGMAWNATYGRCEQSIESACIDQGGVYDALAVTCSIAGVEYTGTTTCANNPYYYSYATASPSPLCYNGVYYWDYITTYNCYNGGTFNTATWQCEKSLQDACLGYVSEPDESYDAETETCTNTDVSYYSTLNFTPVTLTGVGTLPSTVPFGNP